MRLYICYLVFKLLDFQEYIIEEDAHNIQLKKKTVEKKIKLSTAGYQFTMYMYMCVHMCWYMCMYMCVEEN